jgi:Domain of unknown function (DUF1833)
VTLSSTALQSALAGWTDQIWLECLTFEHASIVTPIRLVNDRQDLVRTAGTFTAFPFEFQDFVRADDQSVIAMITADNVDQQIITALRGITGKPEVTYEAVLFDSPNTVERGPMQFEVLGFQTNMTTMSLRISFALSFLSEAFPAGYFAPWNATTI